MESSISNNNMLKNDHNENSTNILENKHYNTNNNNIHFEDIREENDNIGSEKRALSPQNSNRISIDACRFRDSQYLNNKAVPTDINLNTKNIKIKIIDQKKTIKKEPFFYQEIKNINENNNINDTKSTAITINDINIPKKMHQNKHFFSCLNEKNDIETQGPILYVNPVARRAYNPGDGESKDESDYKDTNNKKCCGNCSACYCHLAKYQMFNCCVSENLHCCFEVVCSYLLCIFTYTLFCVFLAARCAYTLCRHR